MGIDIKIPIFSPIFDNGLSKDIILYRAREPLHTRFLYDLINSGTVEKILDIGSNIGYFPLIELEAGAKCIIAIEPIPITFKYLRLNLSRYSSNRYKLINAAIGIEDSKLDIYIPFTQKR